jgi:hypothetical protein
MRRGGVQTVSGDADFAAGAGGLRMSDSGGPGAMFLTIVDAHKIAERVVYAVREVGSAESQFSLTVD